MTSLADSTVLVVDDTKLNVDILLNALGELYDLSVALDGETALEMARNEPPDLILLDIMMPGLNGYEVLRRLKASPRTAGVPVIMLSALAEMESKSKGFQLGAVDYLTKPFELEELLARVKTHLTLARTREELRQHNDLLEQRVRERTREVLLTQQATIESMAILAEFRDPETGEHIHRVKGYVAFLAREMQSHPGYTGLLDTEYIELLINSCPLHDIGKVGVPDHILLKPGKLTEDEFEIMKRHAEYGFGAIEAVQKRLGVMPFLRLAAEIAHTHHERWDGSGYPRGLKGEDIPLSGRIMALADVYDALISRRVYKPPFTHGQAVDIIVQGRGTHFDPDLVDVFAAHDEKFRRIALDNAESEEQREALRL